MFVFVWFWVRLFLNAFVFRSYNVVGGSMENTLHNDDRVIVNRLPVTWAHFWVRNMCRSGADYRICEW